jgi:phospholipid/cholesterol/gamma-HCH transport system ATP-binding protein
MIELVDLHKTFDGQYVLRGVRLTIAEGRLTAIVGASGSGKTVLLKHIVRLLRPDAGQVLIDGIDIAGLRGRSLGRMRERFGVLFQGGALFDSLTIFENVAFPLREKTHASEAEIERRVHDRLAAVGLEDAGPKYLSEISGGMRKRVALARAIILDPQAVLFDEPTTGLDPVRMRSVLRLIRSTHAQFGFTGVLVSHDVPAIFSVVDSVALLDGGVIVEHCSPEEFVRSTHPSVRYFLEGQPE